MVAGLLRRLHAAFGTGPVVTPRVSVVVPVRNGGEDLAACLRALMSQTLARDAYEVIVVDDGSSDGSADLAERLGAQVVRQPQRGAPAARNAGVHAAQAPWVAFTDADCIPSRSWLEQLLAAGARDGLLGAAGATVGYRSASAAARFVDLTHGLDASRHLAHPRWPFAPTANAMYRREALLAVGGFDERFAAYDACDLHTRLRPAPGSFVCAPRAVVLHRHRRTWGAYWRQQRGYGRGLAQFSLRHRDAVGWTALREALAWAGLVPLALRACLPGPADARLVRTGTLVKTAAQRIGFAQAYWGVAERRRWHADARTGRRPGLVTRLRAKVRGPADLILALRIGWFLWSTPHRMRSTDLPRLLDGIRAAPRPTAGDPRSGAERISRLRSLWFALPPMTARNTCFMRALTLYRFLDPAGGELRLHLVVEPARAPGDRLRSHAWVTVDGEVLEEPDLRPSGRIQPLYRHPPEAALTVRPAAP